MSNMHHARFITNKQTKMHNLFRACTCYTYSLKVVPLFGSVSAAPLPPPPAPLMLTVLMQPRALLRVHRR
jgi:hypothetical protein